MPRRSGGAVAPLELREMEPTAGAAERADLPRLLRALATGRRLQVLRLLAGGSADAPAIAHELGVKPAMARRDLLALEEAGLVRKDGDAAEAYHLEQHALRLLKSALNYGARGTQQRPGVRSTPPLPIPPLACTVCENSGFVTGVLGQLGTALTDARQYHRRIKEMSSQVLTAHEAERKRIARELHDDTAQALTSIVVRLRLLERSTDDPQVQQNVGELRELTAGALESVRRMAMDLRPASLDDLGLVPALQAYADRFSDNWPTRVTVTVTGLRRRLRPDVELVLYRVVQEALTNIAKHSSASSAEVELSRRRNEVTLKITDNGVGFDPGGKSEANGSGLGLFGMRERMALVDGQLRIESSRGAGTIITAHVPLGARHNRTGGKNGSG